MQSYQYEFFKAAEFKMLEEELDKVSKSADKVRRGTYANINELRKMIVEMKEDVDIIKRHLCKKE